MTYRDKLRDPRWQKKRLKIFERDDWECRRCHATHKTLNVHHRVYGDGEPWEVPDLWLETLCEDCHKRESDDRERVEVGLLRRMRILGFTILDLAILHDYLDSVTEVDLPGLRAVLTGLDSQHRRDATGCYALPDAVEESIQ